MVIANPIARGGDPMTLLSSSAAAEQMVKSRTNVTINSTRKPNNFDYKLTLVSDYCNHYQHSLNQLFHLCLFLLKFYDTISSLNLLMNKQTLASIQTQSQFCNSRNFVSINVWICKIGLNCLLKYSRCCSNSLISSNMLLFSISSHQYANIL